MKKPKPAHSTNRVRQSSSAALEPTGAPLAGRLSDRLFWLLAAGLAVVFVAGTSREITSPFMGLHSWGKADGARFARAHVVYGLGYTKGLMTEAVGNPPPQPPKHYVNHPQLSALMGAGAMWLMGSVGEWAFRAYWVFMGVLALLTILLVLRPLLGGAWALIAGLIWAILPLTAYFGSGGPGFVTSMLAVYFYLRLIGAFGEVAGPRGRLWAGFVAMNFLTLQFSWTGGFYCLALAIHYAGWCILRRRRPQRPMAAALVVPPLLSASVTLTIMLAGFGWDYKRVLELFLWRAGKGELTATMQVFDWGLWFTTLWDYAVTNFTIPVIILAIVGVLAHVGRRALAYVKARNTDKPVPLLAGSPQLILLLMPGLLQPFILRGALWKHQYWELPLAPFIAVAAALCLMALWDLLRRVGKVFAALVVAIVLAAASVSCVLGANYYYDIRWQHADRIALWKELNHLIPADKSLMTFDAAMDNLTVTQSESKGEVMRAEPAYYIDRPLIQVPSKQQAAVTYPALAAAYARYVQTMNALIYAYEHGAVPDEVAKARQQRAVNTLQTEVHKQFLADLPGILRELDDKRKEAPIYLLPGALYPPQLGAALAVYLQYLADELGKRFTTAYTAPEHETQYDEKGRFFKAGMVSYYVYDLRRPLAGP